MKNLSAIEKLRKIREVKKAFLKLPDVVENLITIKAVFGVKSLDEIEELLLRSGLLIPQIPVRYWEEFMREFCIEFNADKKRFYSTKGYRIDFIRDNLKSETDTRPHYFPKYLIKNFDLTRCIDDMWFLIKEACRENNIYFNAFAENIRSRANRYDMLWEYYFTGKLVFNLKKSGKKIIINKINRTEKQIVDEFRDRQYSSLGTDKNKIQMSINADKLPANCHLHI